MFWWHEVPQIASMLLPALLLPTDCHSVNLTTGSGTNHPDSDCMLVRWHFNAKSHWKIHSWTCGINVVFFFLNNALPVQMFCCASRHCTRSHNCLVLFWLIAILVLTETSKCNPVKKNLGFTGCVIVGCFIETGRRLISIFIFINLQVIMCFSYCYFYQQWALQLLSFPFKYRPFQQTL